MTENLDWKWMVLGSYLIFIGVLLACSFFIYGKKKSRTLPPPKPRKESRVVIELFKISQVLAGTSGEAPSTREQTPNIKPCFDWS